jgi:hypothetical protein
MSFALLLCTLALSGNSESDVLHLPPKVMRGELPVTGRAARLPTRTLGLTRIAGELDLDGWLGDGVLLLCDGGEKEAKELLAQAVGARAAVGRCSPALPLPTRDAPLVVFHLRRAAFYRGVLDRLGGLVQGQDELLAAARDLAGFELAEPQLCVILADGVGADARTNAGLRANLLVHLAAHAFFDAGFGAAPEWLREGFALDVEAELCGEPEAFCRRGPHELTPAGASSASAWTRRLATEWRGADDAAFAEVFALGADRYVEPAAWRALGLVRWLRARRAAKFVALVDALGEPGAAAQAEVVKTVLGKQWRSEFLNDLSGSNSCRGLSGGRGGR